LVWRTYSTHMPLIPQPGVPTIVAHAKYLPYFLMPFEPKDSLGSYGACIEEVHRKGGGYCEVRPHSLQAGRHTSLYRKYEDTGLALSTEAGSE
jgi:hypothetical protein